MYEYPLSLSLPPYLDPPALLSSFFSLPPCSCSIVYFVLSLSIYLISLTLVFISRPLSTHSLTLFYLTFIFSLLPSIPRILPLFLLLFLCNSPSFLPSSLPLPFPSLRLSQTFPCSIPLMACAAPYASFPSHFPSPFPFPVPSNSPARPSY